MKFHKLALIHKNQRGVTLVELLIAILITAVVTGGTTMSVLQVFDVNTRSSNHMTAVRQVQNAGYWISRDTQMAQNVVVSGTSGFPLTLTWTEYLPPNDVHQVVYTLLADNTLQRSHSINGVPSETTIVARFIDPDNTSGGISGGGTFSLPDGNMPPVGVDEFTITDPVGGDSGTIEITAPGGVVKATPFGGATVAGGTDTVTINVGSGPVAWATPVAGSYIVVVAIAMTTEGSWTVTNETATAVMTVDNDGDATFGGVSGLVLTITATVGSGSWEASESRLYEIARRPS